MHSDPLKIDSFKYARKLDHLVNNEERLRTIARKLMDEAFQNPSSLTKIWNILPTRYVTIPLQATIFLGALERKKKKGRIVETDLVDLFLGFCRKKEGEMLSRATFTAIIKAEDVPRFSSLELIKLYSLIERSVQELRPFVEKQGDCAS